MAVLIPAIGACAGRMTPGEKRLAERLEQKLDEDYLLWYDVPVGPKQSHPDFIVIHPNRGVLVLETKGWHIQTIKQVDKEQWTLLTSEGFHTNVKNPATQARHYAIQIVNELVRDSQLLQSEGLHQGKLAFPWGYGVVLTNITRKQFEAAGLDSAIDSHLVICKDEMLDSVDSEEFQKRLWDMFPHVFGKSISDLQLERIRWILFPQVRVPVQGSLLPDDSNDLPDIMRVMDLQQEQLARSLGEGHRVIHGVAGSGKTMILNYRAEHLAKIASSKPILVLCYNEPLAVKLDALLTAKGLAERVHVRNFHKWCRQQLVTFGQPIPSGKDMFDQMVEYVVRAVDQQQIPTGQYQAIMLDEGHDFQPEWLRLITRMVDPETNSLLVLYDSAQNIYGKSKAMGFSFKSVGIQASGRTTILRINYRNTKQILQVANRIAADFLQPDAQDDDGVPLVQPISCGREGATPIIVKLPTSKEEFAKIAELLATAHEEGHAWNDMAILCRDHASMDACAEILAHRQLPHQVRHRSGDFDPRADSIKVMTMHVSKGLEFPIVAVAGVGQMPQEGQAIADEAKLFYVAATRATQRLVVTVAGDSAFAQSLIS